MTRTLNIFQTLGLLCLLLLGAIGGAGAQATITSQNWDSVTAPATPAGWTYSAGVVTTASSPSSSPNALLFGTSGVVSTAIFNTADTAGGNLSVSSSFRFNAPLTEFLLIARATTTSWATLGGYTLDVQDAAASNPGVQISRKTAGGGAYTSMGTRVPGTNISTGVYYRGTLTLSGSTLTATFQRVSDGFYLSSAGTWQASLTSCQTVTDTTFSAAGFYGVGGYGAANSSQSDDFLASTLAPSTSMTASPATAAASASQTETVTGSGTAWVNGATTFSVTGGTGAAITGLSITGQVATFTLNPGTTSGTLTIANSADAATASVTVSAALSITNAAIYRSALWITDGAAIQTANPGNYIKIPIVLPGGGGAVSIGVDVSKMTAQTATEYPTVRVRVDGGAAVDSQLTSGQTSLSAGTLTSGNHIVSVTMLATGSTYSTSPNGWTYGAAQYGLRLTGVAAPSATAFGTYTPKPKRVAWFGDSISRLASTGSGGVNDAELAYPYAVASFYNAEIDNDSWAGQGYNVSGAYGVPSWTNVWNLVDSTHSRLTGGKFAPMPDIIYVSHGQNGSFITSDITAMVGNLRAAATPTTPIFLQFAISRANASAVAAYFAGTPDGHTYLVDMGTQAQADIGSGTYYSPDNIHPYAFYHELLTATALRQMAAVTSAQTGTKRRLQ